MHLSRLWTEERQALPALPLSALREGRWQPSGELSLPRLRKGWWKAFRPLLLSGVRRGRLTDFEFRKTRTQLVLRASSPRNRRQARRKSIFSVTRHRCSLCVIGLFAHRLALPQIPGAFVASEIFGPGGFAGIEIGDVGAECRGFHQHVGVARDLADVEYRHPPPYETCHVVDRPERDVACAEGDDRRSVVVHHGLDFGPGLVDFSMNEALEVHSGVASIHRLAVETELQDVVRGDRLRGD